MKKILILLLILLIVALSLDIYYKTVYNPNIMPIVGSPSLSAASNATTAAGSGELSGALTGNDGQGSR